MPEKLSGAVSAFRASPSHSSTDSLAQTINNNPVLEILPLASGDETPCEPTCPDEQGQDPFGFRGITACGEAINRIESRIEKRRGWTKASHSCPNWLISIVKAFVQILSAKPRVIGWNAEDDHGSILDSNTEEMGALKAAGMTRSWKKPELISCYVLLVFLINLLHLYSVLFPIAAQNAIIEYTDGLNPSDWRIQNPWILMETCGAIGFMIFAKIVNSYSRPWGLFGASLLCVCGLILAVTSSGIEAYTIGMILVEVGKCGLFLVASVVVADSSDLKWRTFYTWCLHCTTCLWFWSSPWFEIQMNHWGNDAFKNWRIATWIFFGGVTLFTIPNVMAFYIFIRRAGGQGYLSQSQQQYSWNICSPSSVLRNIDGFIARNDIWGLSSWTLGLLTLSFGLAIPPNALFSIWKNFLLSLSLGVVAFFVVWEFFLNGLFHRKRPKGNCPVQSGPSLASNPSSTFSFIVMPNPIAISGEDLDARAARTAARLRSQKQPQYFTERGNALLSKSLFQNKELIVCSTCLFLETFSCVLSIWIVRDVPVSSSETQWKRWFLCTNITCATLGGLMSALMIKSWGRIKIFVILGLLVEIISCIIMLAACLWQPIAIDAIYLPQILQGFGSGVVGIPLMVAAQAGCKKRADVAIVTGFLMTLKELALLFGRAVCREITERYSLIEPFDVMRPNTYDSDGGSEPDSIRAAWRILIVTNALVVAVAISTASVGLRNHFLPSLKQHATGMVFGTPDTPPLEEEPDRD